MPRITKKECWDILEDRLLTISETRLGRHIGEAKMAIAVLISSGRDNDENWIESNLFDYYCKMASLHIEPTRLLVLKTLDYLNNGGSAKFRDEVLEA